MAFSRKASSSSKPPRNLKVLIATNLEFFDAKQNEAVLEIYQSIFHSQDRIRVFRVNHWTKIDLLKLWASGFLTKFLFCFWHQDLLDSRLRLKNVVLFAFRNVLYLRLQLAFENSLLCFCHLVFEKHSKLA